MLPLQEQTSNSLVALRRQTEVERSRESERERERARDREREREGEPGKRRDGKGLGRVSD